MRCLAATVFIGVIFVTRAEPGAFTDREVDLLQTFADQAVIAIENVRLFKELQEKNRALTHAHAQVTEALEQQTATAEVLKVISRSTFDLQPVLDTLIENAARLCASQRGVIMRRDGDSYHGVAFYNVSPELTDFIKRHPITPGRHSITARVALERRTIHVADLQADPEYRYALRDADPIRTELGVPIFRGDDIVGVIILHKLEVQPFTDKQIELVETFADQAVIAIENVRLFKELERRNGELTEALEQQTATSEILRVIRSIVSVPMLRGDIAIGAINVLRVEAIPFSDTEIELLKTFADQAVIAIENVRLFTELQAGNRELTTTLDTQTATSDILRVISRSQTDVQPVFDAIVTSAVRLLRAHVGSLTRVAGDQIALAALTSVDAAGDAVLRASEQLTALGDVGRAVSSSLDLDTVLATIVGRAVQLSGTDAGVIYEYDEQRQVFLPRATERLEADIVETMLATPVRKGEGATGRLADIQEPIQLPDIWEAPAESRVRGALVRAGYRALLAVPLVREDRLFGASPSSARPRALLHRRSSNSCGRLRPSRRWPSRTPDCSSRSRRRVISSRSPASTRASF